MIQRIQSIFLFLAAAAFFLLLELPFASTEQVSSGFFGDKVYDVMDHPFLLILVGAGGVLALVALFMYKKRSTQTKLGYFVIILSILVPLIAYLLFINEPGHTATATINDEVGIYLPLIALVMAILANIFIKKDEKVVRSMDRLR